MLWKSIKNPPKRIGEEIESKFLKFANFDGDNLVRLDEGIYDFAQKRFYYEDGSTVRDTNCSHWAYEYEYLELLETVSKE